MTYDVIGYQEIDYEAETSLKLTKIGHVGRVNLYYCATLFSHSLVQGWGTCGQCGPRQNFNCEVYNKMVEYKILRFLKNCVTFNYMLYL